MKSRIVRVILLLLVAAAFGGAAYNISLLERQIARVQSAEQRFSDASARAERTAGELKAAQFAYLAPGQGHVFWVERTGRLLAALSAELKQLEQGDIAAAARADVDALAQVLENVKQVDQSVQAYVRDGQVGLAADLTFTEARQSNLNLVNRVAAARWAQRADASAALRVARRTQLATAAGAGIFALIVLVLLAFTGPAPKMVESTQETRTALGSSLSITVATEPRSTAARQDPPWPPDSLPVAAGLCTDFARLRENKDLPNLLARVAALIDASGIVVWLADPASAELRAAIGHGYSGPTLARMRGIPIGADNATACAYREGKIQVVDADGDGNGAIAVPLPTADGCAGVMAAELRAGGERRPDTQALAAIVAAQMATLVAPQS